MIEIFLYWNYLNNWNLNNSTNLNSAKNTEIKINEK